MRVLFILGVLCLPFASGCACLVDALLDCDDGCHHHCSSEYRYDHACRRGHYSVCGSAPRHCR